jgi:hypothetical protein
VTHATSRSSSGNTTLNPRLRELIETGALDWDNPRHREAYLRAWVKNELPARKAEKPPDDQ